MNKKVLALIAVVVVISIGLIAFNKKDPVNTIDQGVNGEDTVGLETEVSVSDGNLENSEVVVDDLHCDFDLAVEEYKKENGIDKFSADDEFDFYMTLYSQGVDPHGLECDNPLFAGYIKFHEAKGELNTTEPTKPTPSNTDKGITISEDGNTMTNTSGFSFPKADAGVYVPYEEVEQYVSEHCGVDTARKLRALNDGEKNPGGFSDWYEAIQQEYYTTTNWGLSTDGFKNVDERVKYVIDDNYDAMTRTGSQSTDEAW